MIIIKGPLAPAAAAGGPPAGAHRALARFGFRQLRSLCPACTGSCAHSLSVLGLLLGATVTALKVPLGLGPWKKEELGMCNGSPENLLGPGPGIGESALCCQSRSSESSIGSLVAIYVPVRGY